MPFGALNRESTDAIQDILFFHVQSTVSAGLRTNTGAEIAANATVEIGIGRGLVTLSGRGQLFFRKAAPLAQPRDDALSLQAFHVKIDRQALRTAKDGVFLSGSALLGGLGSIVPRQFGRSAQTPKHDKKTREQTNSHKSPMGISSALNVSFLKTPKQKTNNRPEVGIARASKSGRPALQRACSRI